MSAAYGLADSKPWLAEWPAISPRSSGAINCRVPFTVDGVPRVCSTRFEIPKSAILIHQGSGG